MEKVLLALGTIALLGATIYMSHQGVQVPQKLGEIEPQVYDLYSDWKKTNNKKYSTPDQDWYRLTVFNDNYQIVKASFENPELTYTLGFTQFMDMTQQEFAETYLTLQVPQTLKNVEVEEEYTVQAAADWKSAFPGVKNQGGCGSCWAFSAVAAMESHSSIHRSAKVVLSEQDLVDCSSKYGNQGCNGGWMDNAFAYVKANGVATGSDYPYTGRVGTCQSKTRSFKVSGSKTVSGCTGLASEIQKHPVSVAVDASNWNLYTGGYFNNCQSTLNHGVTLAGVESTGNWVVRNSWGTGWGESGYIKLTAGNTCGICNAPSYPTV